MQKPIIYQLLPRLFGNLNERCVPNGTIDQNGCGKMDDISPAVLRSLSLLGVTHVWYTGVIRHASTTDYSRHGIPRNNPAVVKGRAGSPYAIVDYYDICPDLAVNVDERQAEFDNLVKRTHAAGMKVILDFVPNHVAREYRSVARPEGTVDLGDNDDRGKFFARDNNFYYLPGQAFTPPDRCGGYRELPARATGNDCFCPSPGPGDWYETVKLNYGIDPGNGERHFAPIPDTWHKMLQIMLHWVARGVDGLRCDMAHMVPVEFWQWAIGEVKRQNPNTIFIAEIYDVSLYDTYIKQGGFDYLYDKVTLYDSLVKILKYNRSSQEITTCWQTVNPWRNHLLHFMENHDELRLASSCLCGDARPAFPAVVVSATIDTGPMMLYQGQELGERGDDSEGFSGADGRTSIFDYWSMAAVRRWLAGGNLNRRHGLRDRYKKLLGLCNREPAIACGEMFDLMYVNTHLDRQYAFLRHHAGTLLLVVANFDPSAASVTVNLPMHAFDFLHLRQGTFPASELLHNAGETFNLAPDRVVTVEVGGHDAVIWKISLKQPAVTAS